MNDHPYCGGIGCCRSVIESIIATPDPTTPSPRAALEDAGQCGWTKTERCNEPAAAHRHIPVTEGAPWAAGPWDMFPDTLYRHDFVEPKPDGWHTYHICGGRIRETVTSGNQTMCPACGQWLTAYVEQGR